MLVHTRDDICAIVAKDQRGDDVTSRLWHRDRRTVDGFAKRSWIGFAQEHWVELDFDLPRAAAQSGLSQYELLTTVGARYQRVWS